MKTRSKEVQYIQQELENKQIKLSEPQIKQLDDIIVSFTHWNAYNEASLQEAKKAKKKFAQAQKIKVKIIEKAKNTPDNEYSSLDQQRLEKVLNIERRLYGNAQKFLEDSEEYILKLIPDTDDLQQNQLFFSQIRNKLAEIRKIQNMIVEIQQALNIQSKFVVNGFMNEPEEFAEKMLASMAQQLDAIRNTLEGVKKIEAETQLQRKELLQKYIPKAGDIIDASLITPLIFSIMGSTVGYVGVNKENLFITGLSVIIAIACNIPFMMYISMILKDNNQAILKCIPNIIKANKALKTNSSYERYLEVLEKAQ